MKEIKVEAESVVAKSKQVIPVPPPPPPPIPSFWIRKPITESVTNLEIAKFWRKKRIEEEDHLLAAIKAAARIRARNLSEEDYKHFEESLKDEDKEKSPVATKDSNKDEKNYEVRVGIKDWWTKSKYAYLNQPAIESMETPKIRTSNHVPSCFTYKPIPLYPTSLGVF